MTRLRLLFVAKDAKAMAVEDRKIVAAACKAMAIGGKKEHLISSAEAKTAKARSKVDKNRTNLAEATKRATLLCSFSWDYQLSLLSPSFGSYSQLSPQRKMARRLR
jgi:hypothetical protein